MNSIPRRSTRVPTYVVVEVQSDGLAYAGETIVVNLHGALVQISAPLKIGERVTVHVQPTRQSRAAVIVFADYQLSQFGLELEHPENIWGVGIPPKDWLPN